MLRRPLNEQEFSFSKWQTSSKIDLNSMFVQPTSLSVPQLGSRPFDLSNAVMASKEPLHRSKSARLTTHLNEGINTFTTTTDDDLSMADANEYTARTNNVVPDYMDHQDQYLKNDDIWATPAIATAGSSTNLIQQTRLLSWDDKNNNGWTTQSHSPFLTESSRCMEALYQRKFPDALVVQNERLIKDVVNLLIGTPSLCFEWNNHKQSFELRESRIRLVGLSPGVIQRILQPMISFGTRMKMAEDFVAHIQSHPARFGSIAMSFACCLSELLSYIQHSIVSLFTPSPSSSSTNQHVHQPQLLEIHHRMEGFFLIMGHLTDLCSMKTSKGQRYTIPRGGELLTLIYNKALALDDLQSGYPGFLKAIYTTLLINTSTPWLTMMTRWLNDGMIYDPYQDFFISNNEHSNSTDEMATGITVNTSALPCFLPEKYAELVLHAGMSILQQRVDSTTLDEFRLSWLGTSWSSNLERIIHQHVTPKATIYPLTSPPTLFTLPDPDIHLQHEQQSIFQLNEFITNQENDYAPPLPIILRQQLLEPIQHRYQLISSLYVTPSTTSLPSSSSKSIGRCDMLFTYWDGHSDQYPSSFHPDLVTSPFKISTFLLQQRQHSTSLSTPSSSLQSNSINK